MAKATSKRTSSAKTTKAPAAAKPRAKQTPAKKAAGRLPKATSAAKKVPSKKGAKKGTRSGKAKAPHDWQLEGGWVEVFDEVPTNVGASPRALALPISNEPLDIAPETIAAPAASTFPAEFPQEPTSRNDVEAVAEPEPAPEPELEGASEPIPDALPDSMLVAMPDFADEEEDEEEEEDREPVPRPFPDRPIHPEREPAPIEHPDETEPPTPDEEALDVAGPADVGMVVMEEAPIAAGGAQVVVGQRSAMPLSQEMPSKGDLASGLSLPEQFLLVAYRPGWDDKMERARPGGQGAALVGSLLLELALRGAIKVQRGRFIVEDDAASILSPELAAVAAQVRELGPITTQVAMEKLAKGLPDRIRPWVQALERRGVLREERTRKLGVLARSELFLMNEPAKDKLENRLVRTLAGGGNPDARTIMLLGLVSASGLLREMVPASAYDYNRKRIQALLSGRDTLSYRVDNAIRRVQDLALQTVLQDIRVLQGT